MTTLVINLWDSRCGSCGQSADPKEEYHNTVFGYSPGKGCGAKFTEVSSDYANINGLHDSIRAIRPDLEFIGNGVGHGQVNNS